MASFREPDLVGVLEAAYALDLPEPAWLRGVVDAIRPSLDEGLGIAAYLYDTMDRPFRVKHLVVDGCPVDASGVARLQDPAYDDFVRRSWIARAAMTASETPGYDAHPAVHDVLRPAGIRDIMVVNAIDATGVGCWIGAPIADVRVLAPETRERWNRVATHLRASVRLRSRLSSARGGPPETSGAPEAVLTPEGEIVALEGAAETARGTLRDAVRAVQRVRRELRADGDRALLAWPALVRARWSLVDDYAEGDHHYVVARANAVEVQPIARLSHRERQVVACLSSGHTNKETAYELGLSHSTVRVLVARACAKVGVTTREELVAVFRRGTVS